MSEGGNPSTHTLDSTFWPGMSISGLDYTPVEIDEPTQHDPIASAATTFDASDASYWDAVLSSPSFNALSFAEFFDPTFVPLSPVLAFPNTTPGTPSSPATAASAEGSNDTVVCRWSGCGAFVQQQSVWQHVTDTHGHEIRSKSKTLQVCRWTDCTAEFHELRPHVRLHYGVDVHCDACGEVFARDDAARRHKANGACRKCPWCRVRFETVEEKVAHVAKCLKLDVNTKAGRERTVGKVGSVARQAAHPYNN
jgi:hypothetical protein